MHQGMTTTTTHLLAILLATSLSQAADWPQFRGPTRDGISPETGLLSHWPSDGPRELWAYEELGHGYASVSVVADTVYTTGMEDKQGYLVALDREGKLVYRVPYGPEWTGSYPGTRTTPTVDGDFLYLMSGQGRVSCHRRDTGRTVWVVDTIKTFGGKNIRWGIAESVLIQGDTLICTPGGKDATVVALDKRTGKTQWTSQGLSETSAYCSPILVSRGGRALLLTMLEKSIVGLDFATGALLWQVPHKVNYNINADSPAYQDGRLFVSNGYRQGTYGYDLAPDGTAVTELWHEKALDVHHGGLLLVGDTLHGASGKAWFCLDQGTGAIRYQDKLVGKGSGIYADGHLYCYGEKGKLALVKVTPQGYETAGSCEITRGKKEHWAHPALSNGRLYIRHGAVLMCFDVRAK